VIRSWCLSLIAVVACARGGPGAPDAQPDAPDCAKQTYYRDADGDGHGDPAMSVTACEPPAGTVTSKDDCDDANAQRHPGLDEICDGFDNDCAPATTELCPTGCTVVRRQPPNDLIHAYLVCVTTATWANARTTCAGATYKLVEIDDAAENAFVRTAGDAAFGTGVELFIGGSDLTTEGTWVWDGGDPFWQGASGGAPLGGHYTSWNAGEPNNNNGSEDCAVMRADGTWNDYGCGNSLRFICRR
jgi:hypothetical protein